MKKLILEHFPGSRMEKWSNFRNLPRKNWTKIEKSWFWNIFLDPGWKNNQILEKSTFTSKKLKKVEKIEKKMILEHFPGSRMEKWSNFGKINLYLEKVEKVEKNDFKTFSWIQDGKMIKF